MGDLPRSSKVSPQRRNAVGQLFEDEDGHVAHEFLEECAQGLRLKACRRHGSAK